MGKIAFVICINILSGAFSLQAQPDLNKRTEFLKHADTLRLQWLSDAGLLAYLEPYPALTEGEQLVLKFSIKNKATYRLLKEKCSDAGIEAFPAFFLAKMAFIYDFPQSKLTIEIEGTDVKIGIRAVEQLFEKSIEENVFSKMGAQTGEAEEAGTLGFLVIAGDIPITQKFALGTDVKVLKKKIIKRLDKWFHQQNKSWFKKSKLEELANYDQREMLIRVSNIKNVVLDLGYFELLQIRLIFDNPYQPTTLRIELDGKYGAGIIWTPYEDDYIPMLPHYSGQLHFCLEKLQTVLAETLSK